MFEWPGTFAQNLCDFVGNRRNADGIRIILKKRRSINAAFLASTKLINDSLTRIHFSPLETILIMLLEGNRRVKNKNEKFRAKKVILSTKKTKTMLPYQGSESRGHFSNETTYFHLPSYSS